MNRSPIGHSFSPTKSGLLAEASILPPFSGPLGLLRRCLSRLCLILLFLIPLGLMFLGPAPVAWSEPPARQKTASGAADESKAKGRAENKSHGKAGSSQDKGLNWKSLKGSWKICQFGGDGPVEIQDKLIQFGLGDPMTGIQWDGKVTRENYELELEARRTDGFDFFCGLTFPVGKDHVSFILGGWGGGVVGISSVDGRDASDNETTTFRNFDNDQWYRVRVRVDPHEISCWIDDKPAAEQTRKGHKFDIRYEMDLCIPLGVAAFQCDTEYRNIRWRKLTAKEIGKAKKKSAKQIEKSEK